MAGDAAGDGGGLRADCERQIAAIARQVAHNAENADSALRMIAAELVMSIERLEQRVCELERLVDAGDVVQ